MSGKWNGTSWDWNPLVRKYQGTRYTYDYILPNKFNAGEFLSLQLKNLKNSTGSYTKDEVRVMRTGMTNTNSYTTSLVMTTNATVDTTNPAWMQEEDAFVDSKGRLFIIHRVTDPNGVVVSGQYLTVKDANLNTIYQGRMSDQNGNARIFEDAKGRIWVYRMQSSATNPLARLHLLNSDFTLGTTWTISNLFAGKPFDIGVRIAAPRGGNVIGNTLYGTYPYQNTLYAFKIRLPD
jgi:hypothetical protein